MCQPISISLPKNVRNRGLPPRKVKQLQHLLKKRLEKGISRHTFMDHVHYSSRIHFEEHFLQFHLFRDQ